MRPPPSQPTPLSLQSVLQAVFLPLREDTSAPSSEPLNRWPGYASVQGRLIRAPILRAFADSRAPDEVRAWVRAIGTWEFDRVLTAHFASPIKSTPDEYRAAFSYLDGPMPDIKCADWKLLDGLKHVPRRKPRPLQPPCSWSGCSAPLGSSVDCSATLAAISSKTISSVLPSSSISSALVRRDPYPPTSSAADPDYHRVRWGWFRKKTNYAI